VEAFLGVPEELVAAGRVGGGGRSGEGREELRKWRLSVPMEKVRSLRTMFVDAGVLVEIMKVDGILAIPIG